MVACSIKLFGQIALAISVYRLVMSVCLSVNIMVKFFGQAKYRPWTGIQTCLLMDQFSYGILEIIHNLIPINLR